MFQKEIYKCIYFSFNVQGVPEINDRFEIISLVKKSDDDRSVHLVQSDNFIPPIKKIV